MQYKRAKDGHAVYRVTLIHALVHEDIMLLSKRALHRRHTRVRISAVKIALIILLSIGLFGCAPSAQRDSGQPQASGTKGECKATSDNLLFDPQFTSEPPYERTWRQAQHTGERSFDVTAEDGTLQMERIATEPWMLYRQTVQSAALSGATVRYSAELKGDAPGEPMLHGFDHVAGLYIKAGRAPARLADHTPNVGQWDWQVVTIEEKIPEGVTSTRVGFVHQAGGTLWARNPSLVIVDCD